MAQNLVDRRGVPELRRTAFLVTSIGFLLFVYLFSPFSSLFLGWFVDFEDNISHRVHEVTFGVLFAVIFVGVAAQLRRPEKNVAGMQQAILVSAVLSVVVAASTGWEWTALLYVIPPLAIADLHPARREIFRLPAWPSGGMAYLVALAAFPLFAGFVEEFEKAVNEVRGHQAHWGGMATFAVAVPLLGLLASTKSKGWRLVAWTTGLMMVTYGVASTLFPFDASARTDLSAVIVLMWGVLFITVAERSVRKTVVPEAGIEADGQAPVLRRAHKGKLIGGVAAGLARYAGVKPAIIRALFLVPVVGLVVYVIGWVAIPAEKEGDPVQPVGAPPRRNWVRAALTVPALLVLVSAGATVYEVADTFAAPHVPHDIESIRADSCLACHETGSEHAPRINPYTHNFYSDFASERLHISPGLYAECHQLPDVTAMAVPQDYPTDFLLSHGPTQRVRPLADADLGRARTGLARLERVQP